MKTIKIQFNFWMMMLREAPTWVIFRIITLIPLIGYIVAYATFYNWFERNFLWLKAYHFLTSAFILNALWIRYVL